MPSSLIFAGLVVLWLLILVPAVARHQQVVARPSVAALSGRVLTRPVRPMEEDDVQDPDDDRAEPTDLAPHGSTARDPHDGWERPAPRYRPGRGGFDPEAAELAARTRYAFRQRVVLALLATAVVTAGLALLVSPALWWLHGAVDVVLVGYLTYLRRQVRMEEAIRARRAARMAGTRRPQAADDPALDEWARRGRDAARPGDDGYDGAYDGAHDDGFDEERGAGYADDRPAGYADEDDLPETLDPDPDRVAGCGEPAGPLRDRPGDSVEPALPRLAPAPTPPPPAGTVLVDADPDLADLDLPVRVDRRAAG